MQFRKEILKFLELFILKPLQLLKFLLSFLLQQRVFALLGAHAQGEGLELLPHFKGSTLICKDEIVLGVVNHALGAETNPVITAEIFYSFLRVELAHLVKGGGTLSLKLVFMFPNC